jgi:hypothetical protein
MSDPAPEATALTPEPLQTLDPEQKAAAAEMLKQIGGSEIELWNAVLVGQVIKALWLANATRAQTEEALT